MSDYFPEFTASFARLLSTLKGKRVAIFGHIRPDGDCIGSQVALTRLLLTQGIDAVSINEHTVPVNLKNFVGDTPFEQWTVESEMEFDYCISVDCSAPDRMGELLKSRFPNILLCIDHHISNRGFAATNWIDSHAAATAEIIAGVALDAKLPIDATTAQALYVGIATDTGQFRYAATTERVFNLAGNLIRLGADAHGAAHELYERESANRIQLLKQFLNTLETHCNGTLAFAKITQKMFSETGTTREVTEGFIDYARNIDTVDIAALLEEQPDGTVKGSLRSKFATFKVDQLAGKFGGGGHACAAGFSSDIPLQSFPEVFIKTVEAHIKSL